MFLEITAPIGILGVPRNVLPPNTGIEFEMTASVPGRSKPSLRISGPGSDTLIDEFRDSQFIDEMSLVAETSNGSVYQLTWGENLPELIQRVQDVNGTILSAIAFGETWTFELRFLDKMAASHFYTHYDDPDHTITIERANSSETMQQANGDVLTPEQREALTRAVEAGYFEVPRRTTAVELGSELDISDSAVSQRIRRGIQSILQDGTSPQLEVIQSGLQEGD